MEKDLIADACKLIALNYGEYTSSLYQKYYADKDNSHILTSLQELLEEMVGPEKASQQLLPLFKKYTIKKV
jgi:hypothetical protein